MIVDPDFLTHWKTQALCEALEDDSAAPLYVIALWAHCQLRRTDRFEGISHGTFAKICRYPFKGDSGAFFQAMQECGFVDIEGDTVVVHDWAEVNSKLYANWNNGKQNRGVGLPVANPQRTQPEPKTEKAELDVLDKEREDKERKRNPLPPKTSPSARRAGLIPNSEEGKRIAAIFHRGVDTAWSEKEVGMFRKLLPMKDDELSMIERCYAKQWPPDREKNILRHDLGTFLNNYGTEVDRARAWCAKHPAKGAVTLKLLPKQREQPPEYTPEQIAQNKALVAEHMEKLTKQMAGGGS